MKKISNIVMFLAMIIILSGVNVYAATGNIGNLTEDDLIARWSFDEEDGNVVNDTGREAKYHGTVHGTEIVKSIDGNCRYFDGNDYITFNEEFIPKGKKTIRFKMKSNSPISNSNKIMVVLGNTKGWMGVGTRVEISTIGSISFYSTYGGGSSISQTRFSVISKTNVLDGKWHDILVTWDGTTNENTVKIYVDNMFVPDTVGTASKTEIKNADAITEIGRKVISKNWPLTLNIDELQVYDEYYDAGEARLNVLLEEGEEAQLSITSKLPDNLKVSWNSTNEEIATVDENGVVTALKSGLTQVWAENEDGSFREFINVKVIEADEEFRLALDLNVDQSQRLYLNDDYDNIKWTSMDESVATISELGEVTAVSEGLTIVTAEYEDEIRVIYVRVRNEE